MAEQFLAGDSAAGSGTRPWYGDSAYGTGELRGAIHDAGHDAVIKPRPIPVAVTDGFTVGDFTVVSATRRALDARALRDPVCSTSKAHRTAGTAQESTILRSRYIESGWPSQEPTHR